VDMALILPSGIGRRCPEWRELALLSIDSTGGRFVESDCNTSVEVNYILSAENSMENESMIAVKSIS
jgi:hypothetical protein